MPSASAPPCARAASSAMNAAWPSLRCSRPGLDAQRRERADAADAEQDVLREPRVRLADVEARGDPAGGEVVLRPLGVEQVERHAADVDAPDLRGHLHVAHGHRDRERLAVVAGHERGGEPLRVGVDPVLVLPAAGVDALAEVALAVHQPDGDERQRAVGRLLEDVAGERAEAAGVDRERAVHAELRAEVRDRVARRRRARRRTGASRSSRTAASTAAIRSSSAASAAARSSASGSTSTSRRTGFSPQRSQRPGSIDANTSGPSGVHDQR